MTSEMLPGEGEGTVEVPAGTQLTSPFWDGVREGRLHVQHCDSCQRAVFYPRLACPRCGDGALEWQDLDPEGRLETFTVVHRAPRGFVKWAPYAVGIGDFAGARMFGVLDRAEGISVGDAIRFVAGDDVPSELASMPTPYVFCLSDD